MVPSSLVNVSLVTQDSILEDMLQTIVIVLPTLRSLKLEWWLHADFISFEFPEVIKVLQMLARQRNCIMELQLFIWIPGSHMWADQDWERIDQILADRCHFQRLEKLDLQLWVPSGYEMVQFKTTKFPLLSNDSLDFRISYM